MNGANEADILLVVLNRVLFVSQYREGVNNDTENDIQKHNVDYDETGNIVDESNEELAPVCHTVAFSNHHISDST